MGRLFAMISIGLVFSLQVALAADAPVPGAEYAEWAGKTLYPVSVFARMGDKNQAIRQPHLQAYAQTVMGQPDPAAYHAQYVQVFDQFGKSFIAGPKESVQDLLGRNYEDRSAVAGLMHTLAGKCLSGGSADINVSRCNDIYAKQTVEHFDTFRKNGATISQAAQFTQQSLYDSKFDKNTFVAWRKENFSVSQAADFATREKAGQISLKGFQEDVRSFRSFTSNGQFFKNPLASTIQYDKLSRQIVLAAQPYNPNGNFTLDQFKGTYAELRKTLGSEKLAFIASEEIYLKGVDKNAFLKAWASFDAKKMATIAKNPKLRFKLAMLIARGCFKANEFAMQYKNELAEKNNVSLAAARAAYRSVADSQKGNDLDYDKVFKNFDCCGLNWVAVNKAFAQLYAFSEKGSCTSADIQSLLGSDGNAGGNTQAGGGEEVNGMAMLEDEQSDTQP